MKFAAKTRDRVAPPGDHAEAELGSPDGDLAEAALLPRPRQAARLAVAAALLIAVLSAEGCGLFGSKREFQPDVAVMRRQSLGATPDLRMVRNEIMANSSALVTLTADVDAVLSSPVMEPNKLQCSGKLTLAKNIQTRETRVHLVLSRAGSTVVKLVGDGSSYETHMPMLNNLRYGGNYGKPLETNVRRVSFVAEDVADAIDMTLIFEGTSQILRSYPAIWDIYLGNPASPTVAHSAIFVDSVLPLDPKGEILKVVNTIALDRNSGSVIAFDKYTADGALSRRTWFMTWAPVTGPDMRSQDPAANSVTVNVPSDFIILYPPPLEGTVIRMRLARLKLNVPVNEQLFQFRAP
jgi:hypothetical protein